MTPERVLEHSPLVLDQTARERYFADGLLTVPLLARKIYRGLSIPEIGR